MKKKKEIAHYCSNAVLYCEIENKNKNGEKIMKKKQIVIVIEILFCSSLFGFGVGGKCGSLQRHKKYMWLCLCLRCVYLNFEIAIIKCIKWVFFVTWCLCWLYFSFDLSCFFFHFGLPLLLLPFSFIARTSTPFLFF